MSASITAPRHILVADDEPQVVEAIKLLLEFDGHTVQTVPGAREALRALETGEFDLVFTDYAMPGMKGDELAAAIKERYPHQPIVMVTAYAEMLPPALPGVDFIISKPFHLENLREAVTRCARNS